MSEQFYDPQRWAQALADISAEADAVLALAQRASRHAADAARQPEHNTGALKELMRTSVQLRQKIDQLYAALGTAVTDFPGF